MIHAVFLEPLMKLKDALEQETKDKQHRKKDCGLSCIVGVVAHLSSFFFRGLDTLRKKGRGSISDLPIDSVSLSLQDLIGYFQPPDEHLEHEVKQNRLRALKNRQNLFQEEVRLAH